MSTSAKTPVKTSAKKPILKTVKAMPPSKEFSSTAWVKNFAEYKRIKAAADKNPEKFWATQAKTLYWRKPFKKTLQWKFPHATWFADGKLNAAENAIDLQLVNGNKNKAAIIWEGEPGDVVTLTYLQLSLEVNKLANGLKALGVVKGDVVGIYMGMVPEATIAMLACARIGAVHNVIFGGFSSDAVKDRLNDSKAKVLLTQDGVFRKGQTQALKGAIDKGLSEIPTLKKVIVLERTSEETPMTEGRDLWWDEVLDEASPQCEATTCEAEHPLFILYTSGSTGKPKGILHTTGGFLTQAKYTTKYVFDLKSEDIYFCSADIGWITGHSYVTYGPLMNGATVFMYEGVATYPEPDRFWEMISRHRITILYTAPTAIRSFMKTGDEYVRRHDLTSLRLLGSVGEPINPEAWKWYFEVIGGKQCPIVDTWWQTETGGHMITGLPGAVPMKPGSASFALPGILADVVTKEGKPCKTGEDGLLVIKYPWPGMLRTVLGDDDRYVKTYFEEFKKQKYYLAGDGARKDKDGYIWISGRVDDVVNVSGHRLGTAEIESALVSNPNVAEAAVVARPDDLKGSALVAFVTLRSTHKGDLKALKEELRNWVGKEIGPIAKPDEVHFTDALPKTRSGKIMRRLLREFVTTGKTTGDTSTLEDLSSIAKLQTNEED
jgi:acetyl-CoA synthetase